MTREWRVGVDIGGTFTDVIVVNHVTREQRIGKVRSSQGNPISSLVNGLESVGLRWRDVSELVHATTMVTNAIVEADMSRIALVSTRGFGDSIEIGRQDRLHLYRLNLPPKPKPLVPRELRFEVEERLDHNGEILEALDDHAVEAVTEEVKSADVEAVAVSLLHSYANPAHERKMGAALSKVVSHIALSHDVNPEAREYERTSTTMLSAAVMKPVAEYVGKVEEIKPDSTDLYFFHSAGGMTTPDVVRKFPLTLACSGPAAGVTAAAGFTEELGEDQAISFDMGGTTTDVCLIRRGQAEVRSNRMLASRPVRMPMLAVESIGAGGGSIAWLDTGVLRVGPKSAGADPGPACYGRGGVQPTVTDANLVLGYLSADHELGDGTRLDRDAAERALTSISRQIDMTIQEVALGILDVVNANMVRALRRISVDRGVDGRECALLAFGGAGPMHAVQLARSFEMATVLVPNHSSIFSSFGCIMGEKSLTQQQTVRMKSSKWDGEKLAQIRERAIERLRVAWQDSEDVVFEDVAAIRYIGQSYAIEVNQPDWKNPDRLGKAFYEEHERLYGFATTEEWELEALRIRASTPCSVDRVASGACIPADAKPDAVTSQCWFTPQGPVVTPRFDRASMVAGSEIDGPAIIEDRWSTTVVPPGSHLSVDGNGSMRISTGVRR